MNDVMLDVRVIIEELTCAFVDEVSALGDRQGNQACVFIGEAFDRRRAIFGCQRKVYDRTDHACLLYFRATFYDGIKIILFAECIAHRDVLRQYPHAAFTPIGKRTARQKVVQVHRLMCTMKTAYPDMNRSCAKPCSIIRRTLNAGTQLRNACV